MLSIIRIRISSDQIRLFYISVNALKHQKKVVTRIKEVVVEPETYRCPPRKPNENAKPPIVEPPAKYRVRRKSDSQLDEELGQASHPSTLGPATLVKATSTSILADNIREPVMGKINSRIPEDAK